MTIPSYTEQKIKEFDKQFDMADSVWNERAKVFLTTAIEGAANVAEEDIKKELHQTLAKAMRYGRLDGKWRIEVSPELAKIFQDSLQDEPSDLSGITKVTFANGSTLGKDEPKRKE